MYFSAHLGSEIGGDAWCRMARLYATHLGFDVEIRTYPIRSGDRLSVAWFQTRPVLSGIETRGSGAPETVDVLVFTSSGKSIEKRGRLLEGDAWDAMEASLHPAEWWVAVSLLSGELRINLPPASVDRVMYTMDNRGIVIGNDLRLLIRWAGFSVNGLAAYSLLQFGTVPPPWTIATAVHRVPNGHTTTILDKDRTPQQRVSFVIPEESRSGMEFLERDVIDTIDRLLLEIPNGSILFFSGGVDSGLLAARLAALQRTDVHLLNYSVGENDGEARHALQMASYLGLSCTQVFYRPDRLPSVLERIEEEFSFPFEDGFAQMNLMVSEAISLFPDAPVVIQGDGADTTFGAAPRYFDLLFRIPRPIRSAAANLYKAFSIWESPTKLARVIRTVGGTSKLSQECFCVATNQLDGILYLVPEKTRRLLYDQIVADAVNLSHGHPADMLLRLVATLRGECERSVPKSFDPLRMRGVRVAAPYLDPRMLRLSLPQPPECRHDGATNKALLKRMLARSVPSTMVYRPRGGFGAPQGPEFFASTYVQQFMKEVVLSQENEMLSFCNAPAVTRITDRVCEGIVQPPRTYQFLMLLCFVSAWLRQFKSPLS